MQGKQIFQTTSPTRWKSFKWGTRFFIFLLAFCFAALLVIVIAANVIPPIPRLGASIAYNEVLSPDNQVVYKNSELAKRFHGFRQFIDAKYQRNKQYNFAEPKSSAFTPRQFPAAFPTGIRSAFYVAWDPQSFFSLQRNITKLNLIIPEWMFIDPNADTVYTNVDARAFAVMKKAGVNIMPILSNNFKETFRGDAVKRIVNNPTKRERLINDVLKILKQDNFIGVNVDFEDLEQTNDEAFISFQKELYQRLHANHLLVTQDVIPFNGDYDYQQLAKYNDYLFVMAYDQFSSDTKPGPVAEQKWIEAAIDEATKKIPSQKMILGIGSFGYDWPAGARAENVTFQQALTKAKEHNATIDYDNDTYNLHFNYKDDDGRPHDVFFTDAATAFNSMRFAVEAGLSGTAVWRLGSEDYRIWDFYNRDMSKESLKSFDFADFASVESSDDVDYIGSGEILDIRSTPTKGMITTELDSTEMLISEETYSVLPSMFVAEKYGWNGQDTIRNRKKLVLTFDDGPDPEWTPQILDILSREHVPATFFLVGINAENNIPIVKRIYREGHEIGNHTFTHPNVAEISQKRALIEMESTRTLIECITGHSTILFRAPFNADFEPEKLEELTPVAIARSKNYLDIGESVDPMDWEPNITADTIFKRVVEEKEARNAADLGGNIILLHDAGGTTRESTIEALPRIIDYFKKQGYTFTTVADLLGKKRDDLMPAISKKGSGYYLIQASAALFEFGYWAGHFLFTLFIIFIVLSIARIFFMAILAVIEKKRELKRALVMPVLPTYPLVSVIVPAYNEEVNAVSSLHNLLKTDYPNFEVIFVDDGSKDNTYQKVYNEFSNHPKVKVFTKLNGGKASALNYGIHQSEADYVVCIDADTKLKSDAVSQLMKHFLVPRGKGEVGAVAGNVKVGNEVNMLTKWQAIEYISSQNFDRRAFSLLNAITVVPGAIGAFKKQAIEDAGGFTTDTLAEDCDLTIRIIREGYIIENENDALAFTEAPERLKQFIKQRFRWSFGILQTFWKHKELLFNRQVGWLGSLAMPNILLFQYIIPSVIPLADFFMLVGLTTGNAHRILPYYLIFMLVDATVSIIAFWMEGERMSRLIWLVPQRLIYRWLMWIVLFKSVRRAIKGELQNWGVLKRSGNVQERVTA
jgi:cellulose synthase/poly-beta-1,6-N-acetylglucosamine synthase-like glycosyltransferase/spore germination protein YaaH/peptidoglycan/xylan/chitin deacetylase (PgdA/CDA1 family)